MQRPKQITYAVGGVCSAGMLSRNRISGASCFVGVCSGQEHILVKSVLLCYKGVVDCTGQQPILLHLTSQKEKVVVSSSDN